MFVDADDDAVGDSGEIVPTEFFSSNWLVTASRGGETRGARNDAFRGEVRRHHRCHHNPKLANTPDLSENLDSRFHYRYYFID